MYGYSLRLRIRLVELLQGKEFIRSPIHVVSSRASKSAISAIERVGGTVYCKYYNPLALRDCVDGRTDRIAAAPTKRKDIGLSTVHQQVAPSANSLLEWYTHWGHRGYLSPQAIKKMPSVDDRLKEISREFTTFKSQSFETK